MIARSSLPHRWTVTPRSSLVSTRAKCPPLVFLSNRCVHRQRHLHNNAIQRRPAATVAAKRQKMAAELVPGNVGDDAVKRDEKVTPKRGGRPRKADSDQKHVSPETGNLPSILAGSDKHSDLTSFLQYAERTSLDTSTTVYVGLHYEYTVIESLRRLKFDLTRTGRSSDLGIDVVGHWKLPRSAYDNRVLLQCKKEKPQPKHIRELEGAFVGAPAGWKGEGVMAFLVASKEATKGTRDAISRSRWPLGFLNITTGGVVRQLLWNQRCTDIGLEGIGVALRHRQGEAQTEAESEITLLSNGRPLT